MRSRAFHILTACLLPITAIAQGVPVNDGGLTARDLVETRHRETDLGIQRETLSVQELLAEIEREQLAVLQNILDAQTSFGGQGLPAMVSDLEGGSGDAARSGSPRKPSGCPGSVRQASPSSNGARFYKR